MLDIVASYHCIQFQGKPIIQTQENGKKPHFGPDLGPSNPNSSRQISFSKLWLFQSLDVMVSYQQVQYQKKTNLKKTLLRTDGHTDGQTDRQTDGRE